MVSLHTCAVNFLTVTTGGHFACTCVHPLNDNSVGSSNLMAGNQKLAYRYSPFKSHFVGALNTVLSYKKMFSMTKTGRFLRGFSLVDFSAVGSWPFNDFQDSMPKSHVPVYVLFSLGKQCISMI